MIFCMDSSENLSPSIISEVKLLLFLITSIIFSTTSSPYLFDDKSRHVKVSL